MYGGILENCTVSPLVLSLTSELGTILADGAPYELKSAASFISRADLEYTVVLEQAEIGSITSLGFAIGIYVSKRIRLGRQLLASVTHQCRVERTKPTDSRFQESDSQI